MDQAEQLESWRSLSFVIRLSHGNKIAIYFLAFASSSCGLLVLVYYFYFTNLVYNVASLNHEDFTNKKSFRISKKMLYFLLIFSNSLIFFTLLWQLFELQTLVKQNVEMEEILKKVSQANYLLYAAYTYVMVFGGYYGNKLYLMFKQPEINSNPRNSAVMLLLRQFNQAICFYIILMLFSLTFTISGALKDNIKLTFVASIINECGYFSCIILSIGIHKLFKTKKKIIENNADNNL
ncbi:hypothetical protein M0812_29006 [Anaeramoeba flamelloides]|uniref:Uncharacterized protein n=1 Tax=Anaeramoeba flamelloides TaxID=1746091 RepID=A0AAV7Y348_9EUKA|nr:hypothetical protein M0812_29006 [Anaeramoeba flamelloides]